MKQNFLETIVGAVVIALAGYFLYYAVHAQGREKAGGYELLAHFSDVEGLAPGSAVRISGVTVGRVGKIVLDPNTFEATVHLEIAPEYTGKLSRDTMASIASPGLIGDNFMSLIPGNLDDKLKGGDVITDTQSPPSLTALLGQVIFNAGGKNANPSPSPSPNPAATPAPNAGNLPPPPGSADSPHP